MVRSNRQIGFQTSAFAVMLFLAPLVGANTLLSSAAQDEGTATKSILQATADPVAQLQKRIDRGEVKLAYTEAHGYLESLLKALKVPVSSQVLVFSRTSLQTKLISPKTPRAIYFNDDVYVGWPPETEALEVSTVDPATGGVYYMLPQRESGPHRLVRVGQQCLECHNSAMTGGIPGHIMRSVHVLPDGQPDLAAGSYLTTDQSPFDERWGGWYVTGAPGSLRHMGTSEPSVAGSGTSRGEAASDLSKLFDTAPYLSPHSDIVALMVLAHQTHVHNLLARANIESRAALSEEQAVYRELHVSQNSHLQATLKRIEACAEPLVRAMLFVGEARLPSPVQGDTTFSTDFVSRGPRDHHGHSLRDFDLKTRLFRYPCSYLIYSSAFDALPGPARDYVYRRIWRVTSGKETGRDFVHLSPADRKNILAILSETKRSFSAWLRGASHRGVVSPPKPAPRAVRRPPNT